MKGINVFLFLLFLSMSISAQDITVKFGYDAAGNRTGRWIEIIGLKNSDTIVNGQENLIGLIAEINSEDQIITGYKSTQLYPNPVNKHLIVYPGSCFEDEVFFQLIDSNGKVLTKGVKSQFPFSIEFNHLNNGIYYLQIKSEKSNQSYKLIKQ